MKKKAFNELMNSVREAGRIRRRAAKSAKGTLVRRRAMASTAGGERTFRVSRAVERMLRDAIAECDRGDTIPLKQLLSEMRSRERPR